MAPVSQGVGGGTAHGASTSIDLKSAGLTISRYIVDFLLRAHRDKAAARRYFEKAIDQNGEPETITVDKSGANLAALEALNAERPTPIKIRQNKYLNNIVEVRHEVAYRSCSPFSPYRRSEPPVSPGESRSLNQERL